MLWITNQVQFQLFFESRKGFGFPISYRKRVPAAQKAQSLILVLVAGTKTSDNFDDHKLLHKSNVIVAAMQGVRHILNIMQQMPMPFAKED